ncbi:MAG: class I SAM-dependent methyltransferase [Candidatus Aenigmarchaeota archaeon]|nr:class I SAM-dependent methyltransferase [Candidatus Aenigmarchaeota archaeon]
MSRIALAKAVLHGRILDVGHSVGPLHTEIADGRDVTAIDIVIKRPGKNVVKADATRMPFRAQTFDSLLAGEIIEHLDEPGRFVAEGRRVLKDGGTLLLTTPNRRSLLNRLTKAYEKPAHLTLFTRQELVSLLEQHGFRVERLTLLPYTAESSEGSGHPWFFPIRKAMHPFLPAPLQEQFVVIARAV